jgi:Zn-dependent peptidase ImmA (M78 family)
MATAFDDMAFTKPRWALVKQKADELSAPFSAPPIPALEIAERQGVDVIFADFGDANEQVAGFCDFSSAKLYVNASDVTQRQTFTIAHELGHWVLHRRLFEANPKSYQIFPRFQDVDSHNIYEQEANHFAANLLVPLRLLKPVKEASVSSLASAFAVSRSMMEYRLQNVKIYA